MTHPNDPQAELREQIEKALHVDWAFKNKNTKPEKIVILGYPKECGYYLSYEDFVGRVVELLTTERERVIELAIKTLDDIYDYGMGRDEMLEKYSEALKKGTDAK